MKTAAFAALGEMAALREEGVTEPLVLACRGVKEGESTLNLFLTFSFWLNLEWSWMYGQAGQSHHSVQRSAGAAAGTYCSRTGSVRRW